jgi:anti-sigma-K factor RskA
MNHEPFDDLAAVYAVGALDGDDLARFEEHLAAGCERCTAVLRESSEALVELARAVPPAIPPARVKETLLRRAAAFPVAAPRRREPRRRAWLPWAGAAAAAAVVAAALASAFVAARYEARLGVMAREMSAVRARLQRDEAALREEVARYQAAVDLLRDPETRVVTLHGTGPSPAATGRILWNPARGGQLFVANLPPAPAGKAYELWTIAEAPRPAGVFQVDAAGRATHPVEAAPAGTTVKVFAVTLEPAGGVPAPTGPIVLASK